MATRSRGPLAGFAWLQRSIILVFRHPKPLFGGATVLFLVCLVPSLVMLPAERLLLPPDTPPDLTNFGWIMLGSALIGLLIMPMYAGYLQVIDAAENKHPARIRDIFKPYREGEALRLICYGLAIALICTAISATIILATNSNLIGWYAQTLATQTSHQPPPPLPDGIGTVMALCSVFGIFMMGFYAISFNQVALRRHGVINAIGDGCIGALKNLLPILVLVIGLVVLSVVAWIAIVIMAVLTALLAMLIGTWLIFALIILADITITTFAFAIMFGVAYFMWRDVCHDDITTSAIAP